MRCRDARATPDATAIPAMEPSPNRVMYTRRVASVGNSANPSAVIAPRPAAVHEARDQRAPRDRPPPEVHVRTRARVDVPERPVVVRMRRAVRAGAPREAARADAEDDEHHGDAQLERRRIRAGSMAPVARSAVPTASSEIV